MSESALEQRLLEWLGTQGYPLELRVAEACRLAGIEGKPSASFADPESGSSREIDFIGWLGDSFGALEVAVPIESKSGSKPWILLHQRDVLPFNRLQAYGVLSDSVLEAIAGRLQDGPALPSFRKEDGVAHACVQGFTNREDQTFGAVISCVKAALWHAGGSTHDEFASSLRCAFPVVVIDAPLYRCALDDRGDLHLQEVKAGWLYFHHRLPRFQGTCVRIVTILQLPDTLEQLKLEVEALVKFLSPEIGRIRRGAS